MICWKCRDGRTTRHHIGCSKRGNREQSLDATKRWLVEVARQAASQVVGCQPWIGRRSRAAKRVRGDMGWFARAYGETAKEILRRNNEALRSISPLTATSEELKKLAETLGDGFVDSSASNQLRGKVMSIVAV